MSRAPIDLAYMHEMALGLSVGIAVPGSDRAATARDLTARLRCLKALMEEERGGRLDPAIVVPNRRPH